MFVGSIVLLVPGDILILQHASIDTFLKNYLDRNINTDFQNIYLELEPQNALMRLVCLIS
jgi:hypothetical protein